MSLIHYQQATYAGHLREQLELVGCETRVAAIVSRAVGELIDHVSQAETGMRRDMDMRKLDASALKRDLFDRFMGVTVLVLTVAIVSGVLIALFR